MVLHTETLRRGGLVSEHWRAPFPNRRCTVFEAVTRLRLTPLEVEGYVVVGLHLPVPWAALLPGGLSGVSGYNWTVNSTELHRNADRSLQGGNRHLRRAFQIARQPCL